MITWFADNIATIVICLLLILIVVSIIAGMIKDKKNGKHCSCGDCGVCSMGGSCNSNKKEI